MATVGRLAYLVSRVAIAIAVHVISGRIYVAAMMEELIFNFLLALCRIGQHYSRRLRQKAASETEVSVGAMGSILEQNTVKPRSTNLPRTFDRVVTKRLSILGEGEHLHSLPCHSAGRVICFSGPAVPDRKGNALVQGKALTLRWQ
jgi:hypothetical protein